MKNESILDHQELSARLFFPWPNRFPDPFYVEGEDGKLACWYNRKFPDGLTMIHFHGNGDCAVPLDDPCSFRWRG